MNGNKQTQIKPPTAALSANINKFVCNSLGQCAQLSPTHRQQHTTKIKGNILRKQHTKQTNGNVCMQSGLCPDLVRTWSAHVRQHILPHNSAKHTFFLPQMVRDCSGIGPGLVRHCPGTSLDIKKTDAPNTKNIYTTSSHRCYHSKTPTTFAEHPTRIATAFGSTHTVGGLLPGSTGPITVWMHSKWDTFPTGMHKSFQNDTHSIFGHRIARHRAGGHMHELGNVKIGHPQIHEIGKEIIAKTTHTLNTLSKKKL